MKLVDSKCDTGSNTANSFILTKLRLPVTETDPNVSAFLTVQRATGQLPPELQSTKDPLAVELGRRGGLKGGKARAAKLSATKRRAIAKKAARVRWGA